MKTIKCDGCGEETKIPNADSAGEYECPECGKTFMDNRPTT